MSGPKPPVGHAGRDPKPHLPGVLLLDASLRPIWWNPSALRILSFPQEPVASGTSVWMAARVRSALLTRPGLAAAPLDPSNFVARFRSGGRWYDCRSFLLDSSLGFPVVVLLLQRGNANSLLVERVADRYRLTPREQETLQCLLRGLSNKETAQRMRISPNTVKAFLRLIMVKLDVSSRSAILVKVFTGADDSLSREGRHIA